MFVNCNQHFDLIFCFEPVPCIFWIMNKMFLFGFLSYLLYVLEISNFLKIIFLSIVLNVTF